MDALNKKIDFAAAVRILNMQQKGWTGRRNSLHGVQLSTVGMP